MSMVTTPFELIFKFLLLTLCPMLAVSKMIYRELNLTFLLLTLRPRSAVSLTTCRELTFKFLPLTSGWDSYGFSSEFELEKDEWLLMFESSSSIPLSASSKLSTARFCRPLLCSSSNSELFIRESETSGSSSASFAFFYASSMASKSTITFSLFLIRF